MEVIDYYNIVACKRNQGRIDILKEVSQKNVSLVMHQKRLGATSQSVM